MPSGTIEERVRALEVRFEMVEELRDDIHAMKTEMVTTLTSTRVRIDDIGRGLEQLQEAGKTAILEADRRLRWWELLIRSVPMLLMVATFLLVLVQHPMARAAAAAAGVKIPGETP